MAQVKVIKTGRTADKWKRLLTYLQNGTPLVYRCTFPSVELAKRASHSFREIVEQHSYFHLAFVQRGEVCYIFKTNVVQEVKILDE